ncbi:MAG: type II toxin-antitoxin system PrlF family antitoxin [archaeon]|nr:type II toxin-antitoxin system PrlF family antitoxin [archaeon]
MVEITKVYARGQTAIPISIRKKLNIEKDNQLNWTIKDGKMVVEVMKQKSLDDLVGIIELPYETDTVDLKHKSARGLL